MRGSTEYAETFATAVPATAHQASGSTGYHTAPYADSFATAVLASPNVVLPGAAESFATAKVGAPLPALPSLHPPR